MSRSAFAPDGVVVFISLVPYLAARDGRASLAELAERFGTDVESMRELVMVVASNGRPGDTRSYSDADLFEIDWDALDRDEVVVTRFIALEQAPRLSNREAASLLAGLRYLATFPGIADPAAIERLAAKLGGEAAIEAHGDEPSGPEAQLLAEAIRDGRRVRFAYRSRRAGDTVRSVDPARLDVLDGEQFLRGWCLEREEHRTFRLDRMRDLEILDEAVAARPPDDAAGAIYAGRPDDLEVRLRVDIAALPQAIEFLPPGAKDPDASKRGPHDLRVRVGSAERIARLAAEEAGRILVLAPEEVREATAAWAREALAAYEHVDPGA